MRTLEEYLKMPYKLEIIPDLEEGGYAASYPELPGCLTCAEDLETVVKNIQEAKICWLKSALADGIEIPEPERRVNDYSGQFKLRIPKSLHKTLAEHSKEEGLSMNQYCLYLLSKNDTAEFCSKN